MDGDAIKNFNNLIEKLNETRINENIIVGDFKILEIMLLTLPIAVMIVAMSDRIIKKIIDIKNRCKVLVRKNTVNRNMQKEMEVLTSIS